MLPVRKSLNLLLLVWGSISLYSCCQSSGDRHVAIHWESLFSLGAVNLSPAPHSQSFSTLCKTLHWASYSRNTLLFSRLWESSAVKVYRIQSWSRRYLLVWKGIWKLQLVAFGRRNAIGKSPIESFRCYAVTWGFWGISCDRHYRELHFQITISAEKITKNCWHRKTVLRNKVLTGAGQRGERLGGLVKRSTITRGTILQKELKDRNWRLQILLEEFMSRSICFASELHSLSDYKIL